jgi:hypothetical protein
LIYGFAPSTPHTSWFDSSSELQQILPAPGQFVPMVTIHAVAAVVPMLTVDHSVPARANSLDKSSTFGGRGMREAGR